MKENTPLFLAVLLGAFATAIGMGTFLKMANDDRARLAQEIDRARDVAVMAVQEKERVAAEASGKIDQANSEILNAQRVLADLEKERRLLAMAVRLDPPATRDVRNWSPATAEGLEVSLLLPPGTREDMNTDTLFTATRTNTSAAWLRLTPFDARASAELEARFSEAGERAYLVDDRLVSGVVGMYDGLRTWSFRVWHSATSTHSIVFTDPGSLSGDKGVERFLSTMTFGK